MKNSLPYLACVIALPLSTTIFAQELAQPVQPIQSAPVQPGQTVVTVQTAPAVQPTAPAQPVVALSATDQLVLEGKLVPVGNFGDAKFRMTSGSLMVMKGLDANRMDKPILFPDGSTLSTGGTLRRPDGTSLQLLDGQSIGADGKLGLAPTNPDANAPVPGVPNIEAPRSGTLAAPATETTIVVKP